MPYAKSRLIALSALALPFFGLATRYGPVAKDYVRQHENHSRLVAFWWKLIPERRDHS